MCKYIKRASATSVAVLAVALGLLSVGVSTPVGAQDKKLSSSELKHLVANAKEPADHERIAEYFDAEASKYQAEAKEHEELASYYEKHTSS